MFRDFSTGYYQITIFFNDLFILETSNKKMQVSVIKLLYDNDYKIVLNDAKNILDHFELHNVVDFEKLNYSDIKIKPVQFVQLKPDEMNEGRAFVERNGRNVATH